MWKDGAGEEPKGRGRVVGRKGEGLRNSILKGKSVDLYFLLILNGVFKFLN